jgi:2-polyprenyl-6-methoxyphenol hydroxylase-like FAD-dependent oxidoreductase
MPIMGHHAVVLGGSMSGLMAARALADHFVRVTLLERDHVAPERPERPGVPQAAHAHLLLSSGCSVLQEFFPSFRAEMMIRGALGAGLSDEGRWHLPDGRLVCSSTNLRSLLASRALLESFVRERLLRLPNVQVVGGAEVLAFSGSSRRVRGIDVRHHGRQAQELKADLIVDASGRDSQTPRRLERLGVRLPTEDRIHVDMTYTSRVYPRSPEQLDGQLISVIYPRRPNRRCGIALAIEDGRWLVTLGDGIGRPAEGDPASFAKFAASLGAGDLHELVRAQNPLGQAVTTPFGCSLRRRYERPGCLPAGLLVLGDALCSTNPIYAQGMSLAALQARALDRCLRAGTEQLQQRFYTAIGPLLDDAWSIVELGDLGRTPAIEDAVPMAAGLLQGYVGRLQRAAMTDASAALACLRVLLLETPAKSLLAPSLLARALLIGDARPAFMPRPDSDASHARSHH